jgi:hypothetical protein
VTLGLVAYDEGVMSMHSSKKPRNPWAAYIIWRILFFVVPFAGLLPLALSTNMDPFLAGLISAVLASLLGLALSYLVLSGRRQLVADRLEAVRQGKKLKNQDESHEDDVIEASTSEKS